MTTSGTCPSNPLLSTDAFPHYASIKAEHVVPGIRSLLAEASAALEALEASAKPSWEGLVEPLERLDDHLSRSWGAVQHLRMVRDTASLREAVEAVQPETVAFNLRLSQSRPLHAAFRALRDDEATWASLGEARQRVVELQLRDYELYGMGLNEQNQKRFNEIQQELAKLSTTFDNHVLDSTKAFRLVVRDGAQLRGMPRNVLASAAAAAAKDGLEWEPGHACAAEDGEGGQQAKKPEGDKTPGADCGPWVLTLDGPCYVAVMSHAPDAGVREKVYRAYNTRASSGETDNTPVIESILRLRREKAQLLGFDNYARLSMASKMATLERANALLEQLRERALPAARRDLEEVVAFARSKGHAGAKEEEDAALALKHWEVGYWAERLRESKFELKEEELKPYFALPAVLEGLFKLAKRLWGITVEPVDNYDAPSQWHPDCSFFRVLQPDGSVRAYFYLDPYSRPEEKKGGAWMNDVCSRSAALAGDGEAVRLPVALMVCNGSPPADGEPSLLTFRGVETLFHEFGHAAQHMLTLQKEGFVSGIRGVEWDAVELPSQFMENWCYDRATLFGFARHYKTGEPLPEEMYQRLLAARTFRAGTATLSQLYYGMTDLELHTSFVPGAGESVYERELQVARKTMVLPPLPENRMLCGLQHVFSGGYAAGYFSYKWAEVLSADAFAAFEEAGLEDEEQVEKIGQRFAATVLALGGGWSRARYSRSFAAAIPTSKPCCATPTSSPLEPSGGRARVYALVLPSSSPAIVREKLVGLVHNEIQAESASARQPHDRISTPACR